MRTKLRIGTVLICHTNCFYVGTDILASTKGKKYIIKEINFNMFGIIDDCNKEHNFTFERYEGWFIRFDELRKQKLERLENV